MPLSLPNIPLPSNSPLACLFVWGRLKSHWSTKPMNCEWKHWGRRSMSSWLELVSGSSTLEAEFDPYHLFNHTSHRRRDAAPLDEQPFVWECCYSTASCLISSHLINTSVWLCYGTASQPLILSLWSYQLCLSHLIKQTIYSFPSHHCLALWTIL